MSEPRWADVEAGDAIVADRKVTDVTISGTVTRVAGDWVGLGGDGFNISSDFWTLLDIIKPEPQLPTTPGSVVREAVACNRWVYFILHHDGTWRSEWQIAVSAADRAELPCELVYDAGKK